MSKLSFFLRAAPAVLVLALAAPQTASAQFWGGWGGGFGPPPVPPRNVGPGPYFDDAISPRVVSRILAAHGYRMISAPLYNGERVIATGEGAGGARARFYLDAYDGALLRVARGGPQPGPDIAYGQPDAFGQPQIAPGAVPGEPLYQPKPKPKPKPRTAARAVEPKPVAPAKPAPTEATKPPAEPAPVATTPAQPTPSAGAPAPSTAPSASAPVQESASAPTNAAPQASAPSSPQTPLAPDAQPAEASKPADIGPRVQPVAKGPDKAPEPEATKPAEPAAASPSATEQPK